MVSLGTTRGRVLVFVAVLALLPAGIIAIPAPAVIASESHCPSGGTPPPGSRVNGGLDVDGICILDSVTVNGGITVEAGGHLQLTRSTVNGGVVALPCGELDINALTRSGFPTHTTSTIHGGIDIRVSNSNCPRGAFSNVDIWNAQISGEVSMTGNFGRAALPVLCGNEIKGSVTLHNVTAAATFPPFEGTIGDPDSAFASCPGNMISGSLLLFNSSTFAVESNKIAGSVFLVASTLELNGNTIHGSLMCSNGTVILPGEPTDPAGNTVHGENTCP